VTQQLGCPGPGLGQDGFLSPGTLGNAGSFRRGHPRGRGRDPPAMAVLGRASDRSAAAAVAPGGIRSQRPVPRCSRGLPQVGLTLLKEAVLNIAFGSVKLPFLFLFSLLSSKGGPWEVKPCCS
jgi:hypothetical protein